MTELIDDDAVPDVQPGVPCQLFALRCADSHDNQVVLDQRAIFRSNALCSNGSHDRLDLRGQVKVDPVLGVQVA